jgi:hypothetical protein
MGFSELTEWFEQKITKITKITEEWGYLKALVR